METVKITSSALQTDLGERKVVERALEELKAQARPLSVPLSAQLLPLLHTVQDALGYIPAAQVRLIAQKLNLSRAEVHGVISYYHHFRQSPLKGKHIQICRAEACQAVGAKVLWHEACARHGQAHSVEAVYCLGLCATGPAAQVNDRFVAFADVQKLDAEVAR